MCLLIVCLFNCCLDLHINHRVLELMLRKLPGARWSKYRLAGADACARVWKITGGMMLTTLGDSKDTV